MTQENLFKKKMILSSTKTNLTNEFDDDDDVKGDANARADDVDEMESVDDEAPPSMKTSPAFFGTHKKRRSSDFNQQVADQLREVCSVIYYNIVVVVASNTHYFYFLLRFKN